MSVFAVTVLFFVCVLALGVLPFLPALIEWRRKTDAEPLTVVYASTVDARHFANGFRAFAESRFSQALKQCHDTGITERASLDDGTAYVVVGTDGASLLTGVEARARAAHHVVLSASDLNLPDATMFLPEIFAAGTVRGGENNIYRAVLARKDIQLGADSTSLRWLHADREFQAGERTALFGRVTADGTIRLDAECRFERLNAPTITFCSPGDARTALDAKLSNERQVLRAEDLPNRVEVTAGRWLVFGDLDLPRGRVIPADIVVTGSVRVRPGTRIVGSLKAHKDIHLAADVDVSGSLVAARDIVIGRGSRIGGPLVSERAIRIGGGVRLGRVDEPTTVTAENIHIEPGAVAHGTVWAHVEGRVGQRPAVAANGLELERV